jgi:DNA polymerase III subunit delta
MTPEQFLAKIERGQPGPAYLFLGVEAYARGRCRAALIDAVLPDGDRENGLTQFDLGESSLSAVVDDARALSLFAARRLIVVRSAEDALPRLKAGDDGEEAPSGDIAPLVEYLKDPSPGVTLLFEAVRFDFDGEEKKKLERVRKFYAPISDVVELRRYSISQAHSEAQALIKRAGLKLDREALDLLIESLGGDVARIAVEIEKMSLYAGAGKALNADDVAQLVPDARATTIFALVNALGRRDRARALDILDTLTREGEYLPLALAFLSTQFRMALIARESGLRSAQQVQGHFSRAGVPMWGSRAEQVSATAGRFTTEQLERGMTLIFEADRDLRSARPDDRIVMESFILKLTA